MKINLISFAHNKRLTTQLKRYVDKQNADCAREFLLHYFPSKTIQFANDRIILEMADVLIGLKEEEEIEACLGTLKTSITNLIHHYYCQKHKIEKQNSRLHYIYPTNYSLMTSEQRRAAGYSPQLIHDFLIQLDIRDAYRCYTNGYEYEHYQAYEWLLHQINESLASHKHDVA